MSDATAKTEIAAAQQHLNAATAALTPPAIWTPITDRIARAKPAPLALGPAPFPFTDPSFGASLCRVTDEHTSAGKSCRTPSNAVVSAWNCDSTAFAVIDEGMSCLAYRLDAAGVPQKLPTWIGGYTEPAFSFVEPASVYRLGGGQSLTVQKWNIDDGSHVDVLDLVKTFPLLPLVNTYAIAQLADGDRYAVIFGGGSADQHHYVAHSSGAFLDTLTLPTPFRIHGLEIERTGRYVLLGPRQPDIDAGAAKLVIWDVQTGSVTPVTRLTDGHFAVGYGVMVNQCCCAGTETYDGLQWQFRTIATPNATRDVIPSDHMLSPAETFISDHANWRNARPDVVVPFGSATFREVGSTAPWRAWDDEVLLVDPGSATVQRICHHQSIISGDFYTQPILHLSPDGLKAIFDTTWGGTLGGRQDVFLVHLR